MNIPLSVALASVVNTVLQLVVSFGVNITDTQNASITGLVNALLVMLGVIEHYRIKNGSGKTPPPPGA